ncbi:Chorismate mutase / Prephenate dehydratase [Gammaproteobacteria bacterium]
MKDSADLSPLRAKIDDLDERLQDLLNQRAEAALLVARAKLAANPQATFYRPEREAEVLNRVLSRQRGPLSPEAMTRLFREIMSACLALERPLRVAYLGPAGTFTQTAAFKHFGHAIASVPLSSIPEVFREVEANRCDFGVVPVENSTEGGITHTLDMFLQSPLLICGEILVRIHHYLLSHAESLADLTQVVSHAQSLAQCRGWLDHHLPGIERTPVASNAEAAQRAAREPRTAAIAGRAAAELYAVPTLAAHIEDEPKNTTRFLVIGGMPVAPSGRDKTSLLMSCRNVAGGLHRLLAPLAQHGVSMTRIESRPSRQSLWEYVFFVDVEGHQDDAVLRQAFRAAGEEAQWFRVLGSYPAAGDVFSTSSSP